MISRAYSLFENSIKSQYTKRAYDYALRRFVQHYKLRSFDSILEIPDKELQIMLEDWLFHLKKSLRLNTIKPFFQAIELFCIVNDKGGINFKKIHKMYPANDKTSGKRAWTTKEIQTMLENTKEKRIKLLIDILASTGCRIGAISNLVIDDIVEMSRGCIGIKFYSDTDEEYWGFLYPEASSLLRSYLKQREDDGERVTENSPLIREKYKIGISKAKFCTRGSLTMVMDRVVKNSNVRGVKKGMRFDSMTNHGFRKRFNTILKLNKNINPVIVERLMGHRVNLDGSYLDTTRQDVFDEFVKGMHDLVISDSERLRLQNEIKDESIKKIESEKDVLIRQLQEQIKENEETKGKVTKILKHLKLED
ncbi:MAG: tyrosine-type recombinase/integrase [Nitrosotalea sp.]